MGISFTPDLYKLWATLSWDVSQQLRHFLQEVHEQKYKQKVKNVRTFYQFSPLTVVNALLINLPFHSGL